MCEVARIVDGSVALHPSGIDNEWRGGAVGHGGQAAQRCDGKGIDGGEVLPLVFVFIRLPFVPDIGQAFAEHLAELCGEERLAPGRAVVEAYDAVVAVAHREIVDEACAVEIGVGAELEVFRRAFRFQTDDGREAAPLRDEVSEIHLVISSQGAPHSSAEPCLHAAGDAFVIPARGIPPRHGEIAPHRGEGIARLRHHLCTEEAAPPRIARIGAVGHHGVGVFVLEEMCVALGCRRDIVRHVHGRHADGDDVRGQRGSSSVAVVLPVGQHHEGRLYGGPSPHRVVQCLAMLILPYDMRYVLRQRLGKEGQRDPSVHGGVALFIFVYRLRRHCRRQCAQHCGEGRFHDFSHAFSADMAFRELSCVSAARLIWLRHRVLHAAYENPSTAPQQSAASHG